MSSLARTLDDGAPAPEAPQEPEVERCDVCSEPIGEEADDGFEVNGSAVYLWTRGSEVRYEKAPLCASCAAAIGVSALARWEIEEEEG
jgi:hypothetical protein